jgi:hypothetical protein
MKNFERVVQALTGRPGHAFLIEWADAYETDGLRAVRGALLCAAPDGPCGHCAACGDAPHPDWLVAPGGERVRREELAEWPARALVPPFSAVRKVFVVPRAERLTDEAANLLLKLLEEPPPRVVMVLTTSRPADVLPTLASRCRPVRGPIAAPPPPVPPEVDRLLDGEWDRPDWMQYLAPAAWVVRHTLRQGKPAGIARWVERWDALVEAAMALEQNANRDLVRRHLERRMRGEAG